MGWSKRRYGQNSSFLPRHFSHSLRVSPFPFRLFQTQTNNWELITSFKHKPISTNVFLSGNRGREWNEPRKTCSGQMQPLGGSSYPSGQPPSSGVVSKVLSSMKKPVTLLDITTLSQLRKDAHPSSYGGDGGTDCSHWCLPGLPDTWNQLLYAALTMWSVKILKRKCITPLFCKWHS